MTAAVKEIELPKYKMVILFVRRICSCSIFCRCIGDSVMSVCIFLMELEMKCKIYENVMEHTKEKYF